jgi:phosphate-selective porin OprO/OprP
MQGRIEQRLAWTLALMAACGATTVARGQQLDSPVAPNPVGYAPEGVAQAPSPAYQPASTNTQSAVDDPLAVRLSCVEQQLQDIQAKDAAAKKKAAGMPTAIVGGMIQTDFAWFHQNNTSFAQYGNVEDGAEFRRARLKAYGEGFGIMDYCAEMEFGVLATLAVAPSAYTAGMNYGKKAAVPFLPYSEQVSFKDVFIGLHELPLVGNFRIGHFKEPFGLEQQTSDRFTTFMERSMADEGCIVPGRNIGMMVYNWTEDQRATCAMGAFKMNIPSDPGFIDQSDYGNWSVTSRVTWLPWYDEATNGRGLLHLGFACSYRDIGTIPTTQAIDWSNPSSLASVFPFSISSRPEAHLGPKVVSLSLNTLEDVELIGAELAYVDGPLSFQSEFYGAFLHEGAEAAAQGLHGNDFINGGYAYVSYFLTGENRTYNRKSGCFDRISPNENFFRVRDEDGCVQCGKGAWEIGYRYSWVTLDDPAAGLGTTKAAGGWAIDHTLGLNWYLNPYMRLMWNYVYSIDHPDGSVVGTSKQTSNMSTFEMRAAIDF